MAVYTRLTQQDYEVVAKAFGLGRVLEATGIPQGSINTNVRLTASGGRWFLRHTTVRSEADLQFEAALLEHLCDHRFPAPSLRRTREGAESLPLAGGRVSVFGYLAGEELTRERLTHEHLERLGAELGKLHRALNSFGRTRPNPYGPEVVAGWIRELLAHPQPEVQEAASELESALGRSRELPDGMLPSGVVHADLFMDNVKWLVDRVSAFFDFEMACSAPWVLDVAITLNAWCFDQRYQDVLCQALIRGYVGERPLVGVEREALWHHALFGAVRFTASRIRDFHLSPLPPEQLFRKDYRTYLARVRELSALGPKGFGDKLGLA